MKKIISLLCIAVFVLSSCQGKYTVAKRKYNKGFYVSHSKSSKTKAGKQLAEPEKSTAVNDAEIEVVSNTSSAKITAPNESKEELLFSKPQKQSYTSVNNKNSDNNSANLLASDNVYISLKKQAVKELNIASHKKALTQPSKKGSDTNLILLVILCFLWWLNLIAVYLKDGKDITLNFWITLLLNFTVIGGIIFALLVVLDVVDLK